MKNITVSVDDHVYRRARIKAAEVESSVSALVRDFLTRLAGEEPEFTRRLRLEQKTLASIRAFRASDRVSRDRLHDRHALS